MSRKGRFYRKRQSGDSRPETVNLDFFLAEIGARLATARNAPMMGVQYDALVEPVERTQVIIFTMGEVHYAVDVSYVGEVVRGPHITPAPGPPGWMLGETNLHGNIVSIVDLPVFLGVGSPVDRLTAGLIVIRVADQQIGLLVDDIDIIYTFPTEQVISPPFRVGEELLPYLRGAVEREDEFILLLDCECLLLGQGRQQSS